MTELGYGLMRLPLLDPEDPGSLDLEGSKALVDEALQAGFTYFDTAWMYCKHQSEHSVKTLLTDRYPRSAFQVATKLHAAFIKTQEDRDRIFNEQLKRTGLSYFDHYLLHDVREAHYKIYTDLDCFRWLQAKKEAGLVKRIGFSFHDSAEMLDRVLTEHPEMEFVQLQINYLDWESERVQSRKCYEVARKHNKPITVMEPVKGGALSNVPPSVAQLFEKADANRSVSSWAIRFVAGLPGVERVLSGMSNLEQVQDNIHSVREGKPLTEAEQAMLRRAAALINAQKAVPCTGCAYCKEHCPQKIDIPRVFSLYNGARQDPPDPEAKSQYQSLETAAVDCIGCARCEKLCPQDLPISGIMKDISKYFI